MLALSVRTLVYLYDPGACQRHLHDYHKCNANECDSCPWVLQIRCGEES
jgi:hypothetical protein